jgi:Putative metallopeptidase
MRHTLLALSLSIAAVLPAFAATVEVDPVFQGVTRIQEVVGPTQFKLVPVGLLRPGDEVAIQIETTNKVYNDITACLLNEIEARTYQPKSPCRGQIKGRTPFSIREQVSSDGAHYLALDNSYAALIKKDTRATVVTRKTLSSDEVAKIRAGFMNIQAILIATFEGSDFNIFVKPCGQSNAFSSNRTADITLCSEFIHDMSLQRNTGALVAVLLHEYGHSLLNRWGEPGSNEEDMADQFAMAMLLRNGDSGRRLLQEWIGYWLRQDSRAEAQYQLQRGDTHTLSIQRARNIQNTMNLPEEFIRRWNKMLYRHMTRDALDKLIAKPGKSDDIDLALEAIRQK